LVNTTCLRSRPLDAGLHDALKWSPNTPAASDYVTTRGENRTLYAPSAAAECANDGTEIETQ